MNIRWICYQARLVLVFTTSHFIIKSCKRTAYTYSIYTIYCTFIFLGCQQILKIICVIFLHFLHFYKFFLDRSFLPQYNNTVKIQYCQLKYSEHKCEPKTDGSLEKLTEGECRRCKIINLSGKRTERIFKQLQFVVLFILIMQMSFQDIFFYCFSKFILFQGVKKCQNGSQTSTTA